MGNKSTSSVEPFLFDYSLLPDDIWICIFEFIETKKVAQTCKRFYELSKVAKHSFIFNQDSSVKPSDVIRYLSFHNSSISNYHLNGSIWKQVSLEKLRITDDEIQLLLQTCPNIERLELKLNMLLTENYWTLIRDYGKKIKYLASNLHLHTISKLFDDQLQENNSIETLILEPQKSYRQTALISSTIIAGFKKLKQLEIAGIQLEANCECPSVESITFFSHYNFEKHPVLFSTVFPNVNSIKTVVDYYQMQLFFKHFENLNLKRIDLRSFDSPFVDLQQLLSNQAKQNVLEKVALSCSEFLNFFEFENVSQLKEYHGPTSCGSRAMDALNKTWLHRFCENAKSISKLTLTMSVSESELRIICIHLGKQLKSLQLILNQHYSSENWGKYFSQLESLILMSPTLTIQHHFLISLSQNDSIQKSLKQLMLQQCTLHGSAILHSIPKFHHLEFLNMSEIRCRSQNEEERLYDASVTWRKKFIVWFVKRS